MVICLSNLCVEVVYTCKTWWTHFLPRFVQYRGESSTNKAIIVRYLVPRILRTRSRTLFEASPSQAFGRGG